MDLPDPTLSLTLPSIHDGTPLDCRIYLPPSVLAVASDTAPQPAATRAAAPPGPAARWQGHAAVVAHPYAPMGGNYNDPIVKMIANTLLTGDGAGGGAAGTPGPEYVVATFNFRGAGRSPQGRTSWTAKPETGDYMTVAGFLYYFVHHLDPWGDKEGRAGESDTTGPTPTRLLLAGYSYGAMVTSLLPPLAALLAPFARPLRSTPAAEVRLRAARWAAIQNADFAAARERAAKAEAAKAAAAAAPTSPTKSRRGGEARLSMGVRVGSADEEGSHHHHHLPSHHHSLSLRRKSHEVLGRSSMGGGSGVASLKQMLSPASPRRSLSADHRQALVESGDGSDTEKRHGMAGWVSRVRRKGDSRDEVGEKDEKEKEKDEKETKNDHVAALHDLPAVRPAYLLVSPPVGLATNLATMSFGTVVASTAGLFKRRRTDRSADRSADSSEDSVDNGATAATTATVSVPPSDDAKLVANPTLVVYGSDDGFVSYKKMRQWTARLAQASESSGRSGSALAEAKLFRSIEIPTAGHFWVEGRTLYALQETVEAFSREVATMDR